MANERYQHAILIGATGMLSGAAEWITARSRTVWAIGRNPDRLRCLERLGPGRVIPAQIDYRDTAVLRRELERRVDAAGPADVSVCWLHDEGLDALDVIAPFSGTPLRPGRLVHVQSSEAARPGSGGLGQRAAGLARPGELTVQQVVLGFQIEGRHSRWLTNAEISAGVVQALQSGEGRSVVGMVEPWDRRP